MFIDKHSHITVIKNVKSTHTYLLSKMPKRTLSFSNFSLEIQKRSRKLFFDTPHEPIFEQPMESECTLSDVDVSRFGIQ